MFKQMSRGLMSLLALSAVALSACSSMPTFTKCALRQPRRA